MAESLERGHKPISGKEQRIPPIMKGDEER